MVAGAGSVLVASSPGRPGFGAGQHAGGIDDQNGEEPPDLVAGQRDQPGGCGSVVVFVRGDHGEQGVGEHREQGPALPGGPAADLVLVEPSQPLPGLERFFDCPPAAGDVDQLE